MEQKKVKTIVLGENGQRMEEEIECVSIGEVKTDNKEETK